MSGSVTRNLTEQEMQAVLDELEEMAKLDAAVRPVVKAVAASSFDIAKRQLGSAMADVKWDPVRKEELTESEIKRITQLVTKTTMESVQSVVSKGLDEGLPIRDIAKQLEQSHLFSGSRSMMIARTESTRLTNAAALSAMEEATELGLTVWKMWDTAGDGLVRDSHMELDGATVLSDASFNTSEGPIRGPALSGDPSFDINCRCNLLQYIDKEEADEESARRTDEDNPREW